jgi:TolA-binding protein
MEDQAQQSWIDFLRRYPSHPKTDEAYYYLGEIYFRKGQFKEANIELARVFLFPSSAKLAEAAVLIGESYQKNHQEKEARIYWQSVLRRFPKTPMASKARNLLLAIGVDQP